MGVLEELTAEHRVIEGRLELLHEASARLAAGEVAAQDEVRRILQLVGELVTGHHEEREERIVIEGLVERGFPRATGPVGQVVAEHRELHALLAELIAAAARPADAEELVELARGARTFEELLRRHLKREETAIFPLAQVHVPGHVLMRLQRQFDDPAAATAAAAALALAVARGRAHSAA